MRAGVYTARSTLCDWVKFAAELFQPLYELQRRLVLKSTVMWTDDTPVTVIGGVQGSLKFTDSAPTIRYHGQGWRLPSHLSNKKKSRMSPIALLRTSVHMGVFRDQRLGIRD